jgi:glycine cleavage system T protein (aminomethyltransferase)
MVPFAGYDMPVQYGLGILKEHSHTRAAAGLFDVSHMGIAFLEAKDRRHEVIARAFERLVPADILNLRPGQQRYSQLLNSEGGIVDDLMIWRPRAPDQEGVLGIIVNASGKDKNLSYVEASLPSNVAIRRADDEALIALQGPAAEGVLKRHASAATTMSFMQVTDGAIAGLPVRISRSGYTGEDGFEISVAADGAIRLWTALLQDEAVKPIGLGARDSLRLEGGMCLYGSDLDETTSPIEANLTWSIQKRRREGGGFPGDTRIQRELREGPKRLRVGLRPSGAAVLRAKTCIFATDLSEEPIGIVTSGGFGPSVNGPVAMGYVPFEKSKIGTRLFADLRGNRIAIEVHDLPFVPSRFKR